MSNASAPISPLSTAARRLADVFNRLLPEPGRESVPSGAFYPVGAPLAKSAGVVAAAHLLQAPTQDAPVLTAIDRLLAPLRVVLVPIDALIRSSFHTPRLEKAYRDFLAAPVCVWQAVVEIAMPDDSPLWFKELIPDDDEPLAHQFPVNVAPTRVMASYCAQPIAALEAMELATLFPATDPTPAERGLYTLRQLRDKLRGWAAMESLLPFADAHSSTLADKDDPELGRVRLSPADATILNVERVQKLLRQAASLFAELGLNDLAEKCDGPGRLSTLQVEMLLAAGMIRLEEADRCAAANSAPVNGAAAEDKPHFDSVRRQLRWKGAVIKQYRMRAVNQTDILEAFEKAGWPCTIPDPFRDPFKLNQTLRNLNDNFPNGPIRFRGDGAGEGPCWEAVPPAQ